jgi:hypothetical protein
MLEKNSPSPYHNLVSPDYWGGHDILDSDFVTPPHARPAELALPEAEYMELASVLRHRLGRIMRVGVQSSDPQRQGERVVLYEQEELCMASDAPRSNREPFRPKYSRSLRDPNQEHIIERWQVGQYGDETIIFPRIGAEFIRSLHWGIVTSRGKEQYVQPFSLSHTRYKDGDISIGSTQYRDGKVVPAPHDQALVPNARPLPLSQEVVPSKIDFGNGTVVTSLRRYSNVAIIEPKLIVPPPLPRPLPIAIIAPKLWKSVVYFVVKNRCRDVPQIGSIKVSG